MVSFLYNWHFRHNPCFKLPFLFIVGSSFNVFNLKPLIVEQVLGSWPGVIIDIKTSLQDVKVLSGHFLVVYVVGSSFYAPVEIIVSLSSEWETAIQESV